MNFFLFNRLVLSGGIMQKHMNVTSNSSVPRTSPKKEKQTDSDHNPKIANTEKKTAQRTKSSKTSNDEKIDVRHNVTNNIREEICLQYRPPRNSLSEKIFLDNLIDLENMLQDSKNDPNLRDAVGPTSSWTPLYWGVKLGRTECVKILLSYGANINVVVNDCDECCGTVLDLATLRGDNDMETLLREFAEKEDVSLGQSFKAIRTKPRGKAPAFNFRYYGKHKKLDEKKLEQAA